MRKLLILLAVLIATPAFATVTLTESAKTGTTVTVGYSYAEPNGLPRAFALVLQATGGTITSVTPYMTGESGAPTATPALAKGYGIFPGTIVIDSNGNVTDYSTPVEPNGLPGGPSATGTSRVVVALGSLYAGGSDANKPGNTGALFTVVCSSGTTSLNVSEEDTYRGGVVDVNAVALDVDAINITFAVAETITGTPVVAKTTDAPAIDGRVNAVRVESFTASGVAGSLGGTLEYQFDWGDGSTLVWDTAATQTHTFASATTAAWTTNVTVQARLLATPATVSAVSAPIAETGETVKSTATFYATWASFDRPACWGFIRNCRGDTNNAKSGYTPSTYVWVNSADLTCLALAFNKVESDLRLVTCTGGFPGVCTDFNRLKSGYTPSTYVWVNSAYLSILATYFNQVESSVPVCDQSNYNYWTN